MLKVESIRITELIWVRGKPGIRGEEILPVAFVSLNRFRASPTPRTVPLAVRRRSCVLGPLAYQVDSVKASAVRVKELIHLMTQLAQDITC